MPFAKANGIDLCYDERGDGEPLVLIMGIAAQLVHWPDGFVDELASRNLRVIRFDNRDTGHSTWFPDLGTPDIRRLIGRRLLGLPVSAPYSMQDMVDDTVGLLDVLKIHRAHVFGASMGAMIAQAMAIRAPTRVQTLMSFMGTPGSLRFMPTPRAARALLQKPARTKDEAIRSTRHFFAVVGSKGFTRHAEIIDDITSRAWDRGHNPPGFARQLAAIFADGDRTARLRGVRIPTLVVHGLDDPLVLPSAGRATANAIPGAKFLPIQGLGHDLPTDAWPILADAIANHVHLHS